MKRKRSESENRVSDKEIDINPEFIKECEDKFKADQSNIISRNAVVTIGSMLATTDSNRLNDIDHIFMNTLKRKNLKATDQGRSGRCWMFSGLNLFRHTLIRALDLENFEFSQTYLFFWDKLERCNSYLRWFIDNPGVTNKDDECFIYMVENFTNDGGWWSTFANLVKKYGLVPKSAMKETFQSDDSDDMNRIIDEHIQACANYIISCQCDNSTLELKQKLIGIKNETIQKIYSILVKFLGEPPKKFRWSYTNTEDESNIISDLEPTKFMEMVIPDIKLDDFIVLTHIPGTLQYNKIYEVKHTNNLYEGNNFKFLNLPIEELSKYTTKSISSGIPVWFGADVSKDFNPYHSTLDDKLSKQTLVFGETHEFTKGDRIVFRNLQANHAMSIIGMNVGTEGVPESWQVENSWGYFDNETPGMDGFLFMSHSWFVKNVLQVVVHKNLLSRTAKKLLSQSPIMLEPWDCVAPALKINSVNPPKIYEKLKNNILNINSYRS
jgi:bleomycin hydrolase